LNRLEGLDVYFVEQCQDLSPFAVVILPGSKNTCFDLRWLQTTGWDVELNRFAQNNGSITGICGGYQMMGQTVSDPEGLEGKPGVVTGLGLLPIETTLKSPKTTTLTRFSYEGAEGTGYEIHMGHTRRLAGKPLLTVLARNGSTTHEEEGTCQPGTRLMGTYLHGFFDSAAVTRQWLDVMGLHRITVTGVHGPISRDRDYDQLAAHLAAHMNMPAMEALL
jgi:adenosylcobyric acid synthase